MAATSQKRRRYLIATVAAVVAGASIFFAVTEAAGGKLAAGAPAQEVQTTAASQTQVVVSNVGIKAGEQLSAQNITLHSYATADLPASTLTAPGYFTSVAALTSSSKPYFALVDIPPGALIVPTDLATTATQAPPAKNVVLPKSGDVAFAIPYNTLSDAGGYFAPGDVVDVMIDNNGSISYLFTNISVLKVGSIDQQGSLTPNLVVLELTQDQAVTMAQYVDKGTTIRLVVPSQAG